MVAKTNLPEKIINDSAARTRSFFDTYGQEPLEFNATEVDTTLAFFQSKGFSDDASRVTSLTLLKQSKLEGINIFTIIDQLKSLDDIQISALVGEILNNNRPLTSTLGYRQQISTVSKQRNVVP
jgi:hypothetical protein